MNTGLGLKVLGQIMSWDDSRAQSEYAWLVHMARTKYDGYRDFLAGARFIESLAIWLQQFPTDEREAAYAFVRTKLLYFGHREFHRLVESVCPRVVFPNLLQQVSGATRIPYYRVQADESARLLLKRLRRSVLFMALSDGARLDGLRHANVGRLTNEQFVVATQIDDEKWQDLLADLRDDVKDKSAKFHTIYLVDDFMGTGTSFLRFDDEKQRWKGKLIRFHDSGWHNYVVPDCTLCVHHYVASSYGAMGVEYREARCREAKGKDWGLPKARFSYGLRLPASIALNHPDNKDEAILRLAENFYDPAIQTKHTDVGGTSCIRLGYGGCALPLILEHNTPNNSISLLWAETDGLDQDKQPAHHPMRPLFRRRQRHS